MHEWNREAYEAEPQAVMDDAFAFLSLPSAHVTKVAFDDIPPVSSGMGSASRNALLRFYNESEHHGA